MTIPTQDEITLKQIKGILGEVRDALKTLVKIEVEREQRDRELRERFDRAQARMNPCEALR